ncbi:MAG: GvpL/GvpF family gas vesicle protein [Bacteroidales bacterium]
MMIYSILSVKNNSEKLAAHLYQMKGISGLDLVAVSYKEVAAVVCNVQSDALIADQSNAVKYAEIIETLATDYTLLPVRFGSTMESSDQLLQMLERNYTEIQQNLKKLKDKYEFGLKIFCDSEKIKEELRAISEKNTQLKPITGSEPSIYKAYMDKKLKEHRLEEMLLKHVETIVQDITTQVLHLNPIHKFKKTTTASNIIDAVFLIKKSQKDEMIHAVMQLQNCYPSLHFMLTGPWPPYNFVEITIK